jgi:hypothetical protein
MTYSGQMTLAEVAMALGNSETMLRRHYVGRWSREMSSAVWSLLPSTPNQSASQKTDEIAGGDRVVAPLLCKAE